MIKTRTIKYVAAILLEFLIMGPAFADIAPNPIVIKSIYTIDSCKIQMVSEKIYADLYNDSARVECTFELLNFGDSTTIQIGFPEMNFQYWSLGQYNEDDKKNFKIAVNNRILTESEISVPKELESVYNSYMYVFFIDKEYKRKADSIYHANNVEVIKEHVKYKYPSVQSQQETERAFHQLNQWRKSKPQFGSNLWGQFDDQMKKGNFPWYVWHVHFDRNERKTIKVVYSLPSGVGYSSDYRYFKYILATGSGWYKEIENAAIELQLHNINPETVEEITPVGYNIDKTNKSIEWNLTNIEPTSKDDIYVKYFNPMERRNWEKSKKKRKRAIILRHIIPLYWFRL